MKANCLHVMTAMPCREASDALKFELAVSSDSCVTSVRCGYSSKALMRAVAGGARVGDYRTQDCRLTAVNVALLMSYRM